MFKKSDRYWFWAMTIFDVVAILGIISSITVPIFLSVHTQNWLNLLYMFPMLIGVAVGWVFAMLFLSLCFDVKTIRNKLYEQDNTSFKQFSEYQEKIEEQKKKVEYEDEDWESYGSNRG